MLVKSIFSKKKIINFSYLNHREKVVPRLTFPVVDIQPPRHLLLLRTKPLLSVVPVLYTIWSPHILKFFLLFKYLFNYIKYHKRVVFRSILVEQVHPLSAPRSLYSLLSGKTIFLFFSLNSLTHTHTQVCRPKNE